MMVRMFVCFFPSDLIARISGSANLERFERRDLARELRFLGLSYGEISRLIPVSKSTLSGWCGDVELGDRQRERLRRLRPAIVSQERVGVMLKERAEQRRATIRELARAEAEVLIADVGWLAGTVAYWSEGAKTSEMRFTNSDTSLVVLFIWWACTYLPIDLGRLRITLHLHAGQDEAERVRHWSNVTGLPATAFGKTQIKPEGTGHRKNFLYHGTAQLRVTRSGDLLQRVLGWIDAVRRFSGAPLNSCGVLAQLAEQGPLKPKVPGSSPGRPT